MLLVVSVNCLVNVFSPLGKSGIWFKEKERFYVWTGKQGLAKTLLIKFENRSEKRNIMKYCEGFLHRIL